LEKKITDKIVSEERLKKEVESLKRQLNFFKEKLKIDYINPIKKMQLNFLNSPSKITSPTKINKTSYINSNNRTVYKPHKKNISNGNMRYNLFNEISNKKQEIYNNKVDNFYHKKRVVSVDFKKNQIKNNENLLINSNENMKNNSKIKEDSINSGKGVFKKEKNCTNILLRHVKVNKNIGKSNDVNII